MEVGKIYLFIHEHTRVASVARCCDVSFLELVHDIGSNRPAHRCSCRRCAIPLSIVFEPFSYSNWKYSLVIELPLRPSLRTDHKLYDQVYVAWKCTPIFFVKGVVIHNRRDQRTCFIDFEGVYKNCEVSYDCIYIPDAHLLHKVCKEAVFAWLIISRRLGLIKDVGRLIGQHVWMTREEREWEKLVDKSFT
jgi:hypothetical protein